MIKEKNNKSLKSLLSEDLKELVESKEYKKHKKPLTVALGKNEEGNVFIEDLLKIKSILIIGSTGSGKSVLLENLILTLISKNSPDDLKLVLIDNKQVQFGAFETLPHLLEKNKIYRSNEDILNVIDFCLKELDRRYEVFCSVGERKFKTYIKNEKVINGKSEKLAPIVVVIDELSIMLLQDEKYYEKIKNLAFFGGNAGIYLICATQDEKIIAKNHLDYEFFSVSVFHIYGKKKSKKFIDSDDATRLNRSGEMIFNSHFSHNVVKLKIPYDSKREESIEKIVSYLS